MSGCGLGLEDMRVVVTASSRGIGYGVARVLSGCGARVVLNGRDPERLGSAVESLRSAGGWAHGVVADLSREGEAARLVREAAALLGGLDGLVYVPPPVPRGRFLNVSAEEWRLSYRLLVEAAVEAVKEALEHFPAGGGSIVFVTSVAAWEPLEGIATSSVLRPALHGLTVLLARDLGPRGVRVNAVVPGYFLTDRLLGIAEGLARDRGVSVEEAVRMLGSRAALGRVGRPEEAGWVAAFLLSPRASYVTGALVPVTGGLHRSVR